MKQIPILFSTAMVQAILEGRKTQTRRIVKHQPEVDPQTGDWLTKGFGENHEVHPWEDYKEIHKNGWGCRYGKSGDVLWVRETWTPLVTGGPKGFNLYGYKTEDLQDVKWKPSIHMPKEAARIWLEITNVRVERLNKISQQDSISEGIQEFTKDGNIIKYGLDGWEWSKMPKFPRDAFEKLWQSINGADSWRENPWVWVIEFKQIEKPA